MKAFGDDLSVGGSKGVGWVPTTAGCEIPRRALAQFGGPDRISPIGRVHYPKDHATALHLYPTTEGYAGDLLTK